MFQGLSALSAELNPIDQKLILDETSVSTASLITPQIRDCVESVNPFTRHCIRRNDSCSASNYSVNGRQKRQREFDLGRECAKSQLQSFGEYSSVGVNSDRSPNWPAGFVGSISHSKTWTWASVAMESNIRAIGIDTEVVVSPATRLEIQNEIACEHELIKLKQNGLTDEQTLTVAFSAKEAVFKCCYPFIKQYFGFRDAFIESATNSMLRIRPSRRHPKFDQMPSHLDVHYWVSGSDIFTFTCLD